jgi:hypothetical protein
VVACFDETGLELAKDNVSRRGWGPRTERIIAHRKYIMKGKHLTIPLLVDCEATVVIANCVTGSFTAQSVIKFFEDCAPTIRNSDIQFIQLDGATIHDAEVNRVIRTLTNRHGQHLQPLRQPPYSPHLNPCELCNGLFKQLLRWDETPGLTIEAVRRQVVRALEQITQAHLRSFYRSSHFVNVPN